MSLTGTLFSSEISDLRDEKIIAASDSILGSSTDAEFKKTVIKVLQKSNSTNVDLFKKELTEIQRGKPKTEDQLYLFDNIAREYRNSGMNGWDVAWSGILVVFAGLILIAVVVHLFNMVLKEKPAKRKVAVHHHPVKPVVVSGEEVPLEHIIAIASAIELYFRLYIHRSTSGPTFSSPESGSWKIGSKIGIRKIQRKWL